MDKKMTQKPNISLIITIATVLFSIGGSFAVIQLKANAVDKVQEQADNTEKKVVAVETRLEDIKEAIAEQKSDTKAILKLLMEKHR